jgi:hypothetical protein
VLNLDLLLLRDANRFEEMCFRLARYEFPNVIPLAQSWDGGRDLVVFKQPSGHNGDVVFQCKFVKNLIAAKHKIAKSLDALVKNGCHTAQWILCVPVEPSGIFMDWLNGELKDRGIAGSLWARSELLIRLEQHRDVLETFFYSVFAELATHFRSDHLELYKLALDSKCQWSQPDRKVLCFCRRDDVNSPDLVLDVIVRNTGSIGLALTGIQAEVFDRRVQMHGLPGEGLLFPQITYAISIQGGKLGVYVAECEPPLLVKGAELERFKIRITDTGYAWNGGLRVSLQTGAAEQLSLPALRIFT